MTRVWTGLSVSSVKWEDSKRNLCPEARDERRTQALNHMEEMASPVPESQLETQKR